MKKIVYLLGAFLFLTGCSMTNVAMMNTPAKKVEMFLSNYQTLDEEVLTQLDEVVEKEDTFNENQKETYRNIMKKHYQDLTYEIKDEVINGDTATVTAEIEVTDYSKIMTDADTYRDENESEFMNEEGLFDDTLFTSYRLEQLEKADDTVKYTIDFTLTKVEDDWILDNLTDEQSDKLHGLYSY